jgi:hypothetical protein
MTTPGRDERTGAELLLPAEDRIEFIIHALTTRLREAGPLVAARVEWLTDTGEQGHWTAETRGAPVSAGEPRGELGTREGEAK